jgi:hypothetical protein
MKCTDSYFTGIDGEKRGAAVGLGDLLTYGLMVLLVLPPSPISTQLCITAGSMISIGIGYAMTICWLLTYQSRVVPGLPFPVIIYTAYVLLLDVIRDNSNPCSNTSRWGWFSQICLSIASSNKINKNEQNNSFTLKGTVFDTIELSLESIDQIDHRPHIESWQSCSRIACFTPLESSGQWTEDFGWSMMSGCLHYSQHCF